MLDPWTILGVPAGASAQQIHAAWRKGVSRWHPDRNRNPDATLRLQELNAAFASLRGGAVSTGPMDGMADGWVLSGLSGTVYGEAYAATSDVAPDCMRANLEVPVLAWLLDEPITLAIPCIAGVLTLVTLLHPGRLHDGSQLLFRRAGLSPSELATDLVVTIRIAAAAVARPAPMPLQRCA